jgi:uncharacterized protein involved in outer membrane biogenesis
MAKAPRRARRWLLFAALCVLSAGAASAAVPFLIPADRYRVFLQDSLRGATGRDVQIAGLRLQLWPRPHVRATNVRLMNPPGFPPEPGLAAQRIDLGLDLRALLNRRLAVNRIALTGVRVNFLTGPSGRSNFDVPALSRGRPASASQSGSGRPFLTIEPIGVVAIKDAAISAGAYDPRRRAVMPAFGISGVAATSRSVDATAPGWLQRLQVIIDLKGARLALPSLRAPLTVRSGTLLVTGGGVRATFAVTLDKLSATGTAAIPRLNDPAASFTLALPDLDAAQLMRLAAAPVAREPADLPAAGAAHRLIASGTVTVGRFVFAPLAATGVTARVAVYPDAVRVGAFSLTAYGGRVTGAAAVDLAAAGTPVAAALHVRGVNVAALMREIAPGAQRVSGTLAGDVALRTAVGRDPQQALAGAGTFAIRDGTFSGLDVNSALAQIARVLQAGVPAGQTRFSYFGGDLRIARKRVYSSALRLDGDTLQATGHGSIGFDGALDYGGTGLLNQGVAAGAAGTGPLPPAAGLLGSYLGGPGGRTARVPFRLTGSIGNPHFALAGMPQLGTTAAPPSSPQRPAPGSPQIPGLPSFLQNLPGIP